MFVETHDDTFNQRDVKTGADDENNVEIEDGLKVGERVVVNGGTDLLGTAMKSVEAAD